MDTGRCGGMGDGGDGAKKWKKERDVVSTKPKKLFEMNFDYCFLSGI